MSFANKTVSLGTKLKSNVPWWEKHMLPPHVVYIVCDDIHLPKDCRSDVIADTFAGIRFSWQRSVFDLTSNTNSTEAHKGYLNWRPMRTLAPAVCLVAVLAGVNGESHSGRKIIGDAKSWSLEAVRIGQSSSKCGLRREYKRFHWVFTICDIVEKKYCPKSTQFSKVKGKGAKKATANLAHCTDTVFYKSIGSWD